MLVRRQVRIAALDRTADPVGHRRRNQPRQQEQRGRGQASRAPAEQHAADEQRGDRRGPQRDPGAGGGTRQRRRAPLQQGAPRDIHAEQAAHDGVEIEVRLVRQEGQREQGMRELDAHAVAGIAQVLVPQGFLRTVQQVVQRVDQRRQEDHGEHGAGPQPRRRQPAPGHDQRDHHRWRHQRAAQVVEQLPARQQRQRILFAAAARAGHARQQPAKQLPVAADPAVAAADVVAVAARVFLVQLGIAHQAGAHVGAFEQVVTQYLVVGQAVAEHLLEHVHVVNALADERAFQEHVLVHVGDSAGVGVDTRFAAAQFFVERGVFAGQADGHARLQDAVAIDHAAQRLVHARAVERVHHGGDEVARGVAGQLSVGIERDHVPDAFEVGRVAHGQRKLVARAAAQVAVHVLQLAALALVPHPHAFLRIPQARAVQQQERRGRIAIQVQRVFAIEFFYAFAHGLHQRRIAGQGFGGCVGKVGEQAETQVRIAVGQEPHFHLLAQLVDVFATVDQRGYHDQRAGVGRNAAFKIHARQRLGIGDLGGDPVDQVERQLAAADQRQHAHGNEHRAMHAVKRRALEQQCGGDDRQHHDGAQVGRQWRRAAGALQRLHPRPAHAGLLFQRGLAATDQVEAHVAVAQIVAAGVRLRQLQRLRGHFQLRVVGALGDVFDDVAVLVAGGKFHLAVHAGRVLAQGLVNHAQGLDELLPVHGAEVAQAADAVGDRHLVGSLLLDLGLDLLFDGLAGIGQAAGDPRQGHGQCVALALQAAREFRHEGAGNRRVGAGHVGHFQNQAARVLFRFLAHLVGPAVGQIAFAAVVGHARGHAAQVFDQRQAQHDGNRPQLAQLERRHFLVRGHEARQRFRIDAAIAVRDDLERQLVHARAAGRRALGQPWQLLAVVLGQVTAGDADLFFDQVQVIEQPLGGGRDLAAVLDGGGQFVAGGADDFRVFAQARQQLVAAAARAQFVVGGERAAMRGHLRRAEKFRS